MVLRISWLIGGPQGQGVDTSANLFGLSVAKAGYYIFGNREYYSNIKGRHSYFQTIVSDKPVHSVVSYADILVSFEAETVFQHFDEVRKVIVYDPSTSRTGLQFLRMMEPEIAQEKEEVLKKEGLGTTVSDAVAYAVKRGAKAVELDYQSIVTKVSEELNVPMSVAERTRNVAAVGASMKVLGLPIEYLDQAISATFKNELFVKMNSLAARLAYDQVPAVHSLSPIKRDEPRVWIDGNTAVALGKLAGGLRFQSYYPITPAADESVYLEANQVVEMEADVLNKGGVVVVQAEDELAAINMASGAALTGTRSATSTSGPGFSLMAEGIGWAGMNEVPVVITYYMRGAPSTGQPTRTGQADLKFALNVSHGEFPRIVIASGDHVEAFWDAIWALNLAERYQTPVIHLLEKALASSYVVAEESNFKGVYPIDRGKLIKPTTDFFPRFQFTDDGISPRVRLGDTGVLYTGDEHNEWGQIAEASTNRRMMYEKRMKKLETADREIPEEKRLNVFGQGDYAIITWGFTKGAIVDVLDELERMGVMAVQIRMFNPYPKGLVKKLLEGKRAIIAVESNYSAQGAEVMTEQTGIFPTHYVLKYNGRIITSDELLEGVKRALSGERRVVLSAGA
ncbi:MAG: 2-oxoacid:ferredoxin oxidoreductase subunit alpha [Thermoprotei archaeon]